MKQLLLWALLLFAAWKGYEYFVGRSAQEAAPGPAAVDASHDRSAPASVAFTCNGRAHCSQMTSRGEVEFFIRHCSSTRMDGDNDGEPCENDSRF